MCVIDKFLAKAHNSNRFAFCTTISRERHRRLDMRNFVVLSRERKQLAGHWQFP